jgi:hypothetical protein
MYICEVCNYISSSYHNFSQHNTTKKHILKTKIYKNDTDLTNTNIFSCINCKKAYKYQSGLSRHYKICNFQINSIENARIKADSLITIEKLKCKNKLKLKDLEKELELKALENKHLKSQIVNNNSQTNITVNNNVKISKLQYLNNNFSNVIDINTFIDNYKNKYGLTNDQTKILLENYQSDGINACISAMVYYLKKSAVQQYKELNGLDIKMENIILPFLLSDKSLREHFEKSVNGKWDKTTMCDNIKRLVTITNDQVYKHHQQFMDINGPQRKRIINGILKASCYSVLTHISDPYVYKCIEGTDTNIINDVVSKNTTDTMKDTKDTKDIKDIKDLVNNDTKDKDIKDKDIKDTTTENKSDQIVVTSVNEFFTEYSEDESDDDDEYEDDDDMYDYDTETDDDYTNRKEK